MKEKELKKKSEENLSSTISEAVAIIGMSCRFPTAPTLEAFWDLLQSGRDTIREIPVERWNYSDYYDKDPNARNGMLLCWRTFTISIRCSFQFPLLKRQK
jgi:acyl transferase domain-containing protein